MKLTDLTNVYFSCTGNTCRSPLAQRIMLEKLREKGIRSISVHSKMSSVSDGEWNKWSNYSDGKISPGARKIILDKLGDTAFVDNHQATVFSKEELEEADLLITMDAVMKRKLLLYDEAINKDGNGKVYTLGELIGRPQERVEDPILDNLKHLASWRGRTGFDDEDAFYSDWNLDSSGISDNKHLYEKKYGYDNYSYDDTRSEVDHYLKVFEQLEEMIVQLLEMNEIIFQPVSEFTIEPSKPTYKSFRFWKEIK